MLVSLPDGFISHFTKKRAFSLYFQIQANFPSFSFRSISTSATLSIYRTSQLPFSPYVLVLTRTCPQQPDLILLVPWSCFHEQSRFEGMEHVHFLLNTISSSDFGFRIFMLDIQKYLKDNTPQRISSFPKPTSPLRSQLSKAAESEVKAQTLGIIVGNLLVFSSQSSASGLTQSRNWTNTYWMKLTHFYFHLLELFLFLLPRSAQTLSITWLADCFSINHYHIFILRIFSSLLTTSFIYDILKVLTKFSTKFLWVEINFFP